MSDSIDNTKELDSYGVWVKTPPQDASLSSDTQETQTDTDMPDFSDLDLMAQTDDLTKDEPSVSDDFSFDASATGESSISDTEAESLKNEAEDPFADIQDFGITEESAASQNDEEPAAEQNSDVETEFSAEDFLSDNSTGDTAEQDTGTETEISADDFLSDSSDENSGEQELSLDDFMDGDFSDPNPSGAPESHSDDGEISLDDFFDDDSSSKEKEDDITNDEALDIDLSFTEGEENEVPTVDNTDSISDSDAEESAEDAASEFDDMFESLDQETGSAPADTASETEEISMDDFGFSSEQEEPAAQAGADSSDSEEVDLSDFGIDSNAEETAVHQDVQEAKKNQVVDYDLAISDDDTNAAAPTASEIESSDNSSEKEEKVAVPENATVVDNSILERIMTELSGLKSEINNLKSDFETLKNQETIPVQENASTPHPAEESAASEESTDDSFEAIVAEGEPAEESVQEREIPEIPEPETSGFFSNDDQDETIALSGDELNNVMNSADFSEIESEEIEAPAEVSATEEQVLDEAVSDETPATEINDIPEPETSGFFNSDDQDETIALSGDELNNVMNSADFSELQIEEIESPFEETIPSENSAEDTPAAEDFSTDFTDENPFGGIEDISDTSESHGEVDSGLSMKMDNEILEEPDLSSIDSPDFESEISIPKVDDISESSEKATEEERLDNVLVESSVNDLMDSVSESEIPEMPETEELYSEPAETDVESESLDSLLDSSMTEDALTESTEDLAATDSVSETTETALDVDEEITEPEVTVSKEIAEPSEESPVEEIPESFEPDSAEDAEPLENIETEIAGTVEADTGTFEELTGEDASIDSLLAPEADIATSLSEENVDYLNDGENFADSDAESITNEENSETEGMNIPELNEEKPEAVSSIKDDSVPADLKNDIRSVLLYMDQLLENLPEEKIVEFAKSEQFTTYKRLFNELGLS